MRKLKSTEKRKRVVNGLLAFGAVALLTTGFATWIVGVNQREANGGVGVQVDTAQKNNVNFTFEITGDREIFVGEKTNNNDDNFVNITGNDEKETDFNVGVKITIEVGADVDVKPTKVSLAINYEGKGLDEEANNDAAKGNLVKYKDGSDSSDGTLPTPKTHTAGDYTYIDINDEFTSTLTLPSESGGNWTYTENDGDLKYEYTNDNVTLFTWGSYFNHGSPSTFYNDLYKKGTLKNTSEDVNLVYSQLLEMKKVFMNEPTEDSFEWTPKTLNILATLE